jgi:hypothetical protein
MVQRRYGGVVSFGVGYGKSGSAVRWICIQLVGVGQNPMEERLKTTRHIQARAVWNDCSRYGVWLGSIVEWTGPPSEPLKVLRAA